MVDVNLLERNATTDDIQNEILNLIYVIFNIFVQYMPLILILGIASGFILLIGRMVKSAKGLGG